MTLDCSGSDALLHRFPPGRPTPPHSIRSLSNPTLGLAPYQIPLPFPDFKKSTFDDLWAASPVYITEDEVVDVRDEQEFLGPRWRVITQEIGVSVFDQIRCGTRVVFRGVDLEDVSYFVIGYRLRRGTVSYVDVFAYRREDAKPISNSVLWPPFTMCVPERALHHSMRLNNRSQDWVNNINSRASDREVERRLVTADSGGSSFASIGRFWCNLFDGLSCFGAHE